MAKPPISYRHRVCVICEGLEDTEYFNRLLQLNVWCTDIYDFYPINAKSASNILELSRNVQSENTQNLG